MLGGVSFTKPGVDAEDAKLMQAPDYRQPVPALYVVVVFINTGGGLLDAAGVHTTLTEGHFTTCPITRWVGAAPARRTQSLPASCQHMIAPPS